jgi:TPR repeat protein
LCQHGIGAPQDYDEALKYYELLAKDRHEPAQLGCAQIFHAKKDLDKAFEYCQMAAQQDYLAALNLLTCLRK